MIIAIDFDGTLVDHRFPDIGAEVPGAIRWLKEFQAAGARLVLWSVRRDEAITADRPLTAAVEWCRARGLEFWGVNDNPDQTPPRSSGSKIDANLYIDDRAFGCPLRDFYRAGSRPVVDWDRVGPVVLAMLEARGSEP